MPLDARGEAAAPSAAVSRRALNNNREAVRPLQRRMNRAEGGGAALTSEASTPSLSRTYRHKGHLLIPLPPLPPRRASRSAGGAEGALLLLRG